ncbi:MAG: AraC family transcriptional regulator [Pseudomonadota bacterium]|nr:AraC family transcriptional regulator [Pseudomonadota bacterium]
MRDEHLWDVTQQRLSRLTGNDQTRPVTLQVANPYSVMARGDIGAVELGVGIGLMRGVMNGTRTLRAHAEALPGLQIEGRLAGHSTSRELTPPHRGGTLEADHLAVNGFSAGSLWEIEIPAQSVVETVTLTYSPVFIENLGQDRTVHALRNLLAEQKGFDRPLSMSERSRFLWLLAADLSGIAAKIEAQAFALTLLASVLHYVGDPSGRDGLTIADRQIVDFARQMIDDHPAHLPPLSIAEIARRCGCNEQKLRRRFKHEVGLTLSAYATARKVEWAQTLLRADHPIARVAREVGYASPEAFASAFRRLVGQSPRQWRRKRDD